MSKNNVAEIFSLHHPAKNNIGIYKYGDLVVLFLYMFTMGYNAINIKTVVYR